MTATSTNTPAEKLANILGEITYRLETNFEVFNRYYGQNSTFKTEECYKDIIADIERLKILKSKLQDLDMVNYIKEQDEKEKQT